MAAIIPLVAALSSHYPELVERTKKEESYPVFTYFLLKGIVPTRIATCTPLFLDVLFHHGSC